MIVTMCSCDLLSYVDCHILGRCKNINYTIQQNNVWYGNNLFGIPRYTIHYCKIVNVLIVKIMLCLEATLRIQ